MLPQSQYSPTPAPLTVSATVLPQAKSMTSHRVAEGFYSCLLAVAVLSSAAVDCTIGSAVTRQVCRVPIKHVRSSNVAHWFQQLCPLISASFAFSPQAWPLDKFPMRKVGKMVLNQNIDNFHNESEQIAFNPGTVVPGTEHHAVCIGCTLAYMGYSCCTLCDALSRGCE